MDKCVMLFPILHRVRYIVVYVSLLNSFPPPFSSHIQEYNAENENGFDFATWWQPVSEHSNLGLPFINVKFFSCPFSLQGGIATG